MCFLLRTFHLVKNLSYSSRCFFFEKMTEIVLVSKVTIQIRVLNYFFKHDFKHFFGLTFSCHDYLVFTLESMP